ncbi:hypothetical protein ACFPYM_00665 [Methylobacterium hispanicum]
MAAGVDLGAGTSQAATSTLSDGCLEGAVVGPSGAELGGVGFPGLVGVAHPGEGAGRVSQSRRMSLAETVANTGSGMLISWLIGLVVYPAFGFPVGAGQALALTAIFTVVSVARGYAWRRAFERFRRS